MRVVWFQELQSWWLPPGTALGARACAVRVVLGSIRLPERGAADLDPRPSRPLSSTTPLGASQRRPCVSRKQVGQRFGSLARCRLNRAGCSGTMVARAKMHLVLATAVCAVMLGDAVPFDAAEGGRTTLNFNFGWLHHRGDPAGTADTCQFPENLTGYSCKWVAARLTGCGGDWSP